MVSESTTVLLDGKQLSKEVKESIAREVEQWKSSGGKTPHLAAILVGSDGASETYVNHKVKACEQVGFKSTLKRFDSSITEAELLNEISKLNEDRDIDGFIVQLPLPDHISSDKVINAIDPKKDVDGFHPENVGRLTLNLPAYISATPFGIMQLLKRYDIETSGKYCVILGRSNIVGRPMSILMSRNTNPGNATVTLCHSRTTDLRSITKQADILIVALGKPEFVTADMVKENAVVIDVGITRVSDESAKRGYRLKGDVKFDEVAEKAAFITPVPGGVGPMTVTSLLANTLQACKKEIYK
ncbi:MAG: bifunctional methylenetetrahydrofolate dehydrogenase/methenyltetrahydrofolate cyclohydrolase FolD [Chitinophagales bacterium]|nr:bifunctional methylenetetrahydrofolate dehydrogenase/methenyltetrahydrofolate cyclohydrolase FolD [Chitinophagales bacterium]